MIFALLSGSEALANGQSTHVWISEHAKEHLPEGDLRNLVTDPAVQQALINGTMFPDGGYAIGDDYGEMAHWEPLQNDYRDWIVANYSAPWSDEAAQHVAFLLGMASHGIADQTFDALFMERSKQEDAEGGWDDNFDLATDVVMMQRVGAMTPPEHWLPARSLVDIYQDGFGYTISQSDMEDAQELLRFAITSVGLFSQDPGIVSTYEAAFPWAAQTIDDPDEPGSPPCEGELLALYWQSVWDRLNGDLGSAPRVLKTFPADGALGHSTDSSLVQTRISLVFSEALRQDSLREDVIVLVDDTGGVVPTSAWLFYRDMSHVVHIAPLEDLAVDAWYTVQIGAGLEGIEGGVTEEEAFFQFSTAPIPEADTAADTARGPTTKGKSGCGGCALAPSGNGGVSWLGGLLCVVGFRRYRRS